MPTEKNQYVEVKARFKYCDKNVEAIVINPGDCQGKSWMVFVDDNAWPDYYIVEAVSPSKAEEVFADSEYGKNVRLSYEDLAGCPDNDAHYTGSGTPYDSESIVVHGVEDEQIPWLCKYHAPGLPVNGIDPPALEDYTSEDCSVCGERCYTLHDEVPVCSVTCATELAKLFSW